MKQRELKKKIRGINMDFRKNFLPAFVEDFFHDASEGSICQHLFWFFEVFFQYPITKKMCHPPPLKKKINLKF